ncbi:hypothetical protein Smp_191100 [Schistosoma mansoni]|uniref:hypothetical protein n=1 Tax=Schistosoma mansoni TaxID=6183 RepID=UPI00022C874F|nr:hypothetical protein Smp_191100 [Schistosoma mansoni]|eukprot:XP_018644101.1 hypothetical protein Smp_191100 [Schistosoma mansoni]
MPAPFVEDAFFIPLYIFSFFVEDQMFVRVWVNTRIFNSIPLVCLSIFVPIPSCFQDYSSIIELEVRDIDASGRCLVEQGCFGYPGSFVFPYKIDYCSFKVCEELCWDFNGDSIESVDCFWQDCHFYYIDPTYPRAWEIFPFSEGFFNFFL